MKPALAILALFVIVISAIAWSQQKAETQRKAKAEQQIIDARRRQIELQQKINDDFAERLAEDKETREFNRSLYGTDDPPPEVTQRNIEKNLEKLVKQSSNSR